MYKLTLITALAIGITFSTISAIAGEVDCTPQPQLTTSLCKDLPLGPRFWLRR